jgi:predicted component of type VI protein secretion system
MPTLTIQLPNLPPVEHVLRDETMTIGRMKGNTIALDDASVSISHAKITRNGADFFVKDLNSTNGTMLNGQSIVEAKLRDGDQIKFGEVVAYFRVEPTVAGTTSTPAKPAPTPQPAPAAPVTAPANPPPSPPQPSTSFVSTRLVTKAAPAPAPAKSEMRSVRRAKKKNAWVFPAIGIVAALAVAGVLGWMFFGGGEKNPGTTITPAPTAPSAANPKPISKPAITESSSGPSITELTKQLKSSDVEVRRRAAAELHARGTTARDAVPQMREALKDSDPDVRMWAALSLINNKFYDKATVPILLQTLRRDDPMLRQVSCLSLALIPYDENEKTNVVAALIEVGAKDSDDEVRRSAISALRIIAPEVLNEK